MKNGKCNAICFPPLLYLIAGLKRELKQVELLSLMALVKKPFSYVKLPISL